METNNQTTGLVSVLATVAAITAGMFLIGRFDVDTGRLTQVLLTKNVTDIPPANEHATYRALATEPLDQYIDQKVDNWDGKDITLFFKAENGILDHWDSTQASKAVA